MASGAELAMILRAKDEASGVFEKVKSAAGGLGSGISSGISAGMGALGSFGLAVQGVHAAIDTLKGVGNLFGIGALSEMEQTRASFMAFTKDAGQTEQILQQVRAEASKTPFAFGEMAKATASLMPVAKSSGVALMDLVKEAEILAASNPLEGLEGASFSLREAMTGDFTSIIERFNLSRQSINKWKAEGVPNIEIVRRAMAEMGFDSDLIAAKAETLEGRWSTFQDTLVELQMTAGQPIFDLLKDGLTSLQGLLDGNGDSLKLFAEGIAQTIRDVISVSRDLFDIFQGGDSFDGADSVLSKLFPVEVVDFILESVRQIGDAFRTVIQVFTEGWEPSETVEPLSNALGSLALVLRDVVIPAVLAVGGFILEQFGQVVSWVQANWPLIQQTIMTVLTAIQTFWQQHGEQILSIVRSMWEIVKTVISTAVANFLDIIKLGMQLINGDWEGAWETFKGIISRQMEAASTILSAGFDILYTVIDAATGGMLTRIEQWMTDTANAITTGMDTVRTTISGAWETIQTTIDGIMPAIKAAIMTVWTALPEDIRNDLVTIANHIVTQGAQWVTNLTTAGTNMLTAIQTKLNEMVTAVTTWASTTFLAPILALATTAGTAATAVGTAIWEAITTKLNAIITAVSGWVDQFLAPIRGMAGTARAEASSVGQAIVDGITNAISAGIGSIRDMAYRAARAALDAAKSALGIESPSRVFAQEVGLPIVQGAALGILSATPLAVQAASAMAEAARQAAMGQRPVISGMLGALGATIGQGITPGIRQFGQLASGSIIPGQIGGQGGGLIPIGPGTVKVDVYVGQQKLDDMWVQSRERVTRQGR